MKPRLDLDQLERLLETLEPEQIRDQYAEDLRADPALDAMLRHFEGMDGDLQRLRSADQPPVFQVPQRRTARVWLPWALPLAAALVLAIFAGSRLLPFPEKSAGLEMAMDRKIVFEDEAARGAPAAAGPTDQEATPAREDEARGSFAGVVVPEETAPAPIGETNEKKDAREGARALSKTKEAQSEKESGKDDAASPAEEPEELLTFGVEEAVAQSSPAKKEPSQDRARQAPVATAPEADKAPGSTGRDVEKLGASRSGPLPTLGEQLADLDTARAKANQPEPVLESEGESDPVSRVGRMEDPKTQDANLEEAADYQELLVQPSPRAAAKNSRRENKASPDHQSWLDRLQAAWQARDENAVAKLFSKNTSVSWPLLANSSLNHAGLDRSWRELMKNPLPPIHLEILSSHKREALVRWQILAQSIQPGPANQGGDLVLRFNRRGLCEYAGKP